MDKDTLEKVKNTLAENDIEYAALFGSRARGDNRPDSDYDILIRFKKNKVPGFFGYIGIEERLSEILEERVDLVTQEALSPYIRDRVLKELKVIYQ